MSFFVKFFKKNIFANASNRFSVASNSRANTEVFDISSAKPSLSSEQRFRSFVYVFLMLSRVLFFFLAIFLYPFIPFLFVIVFILLAAILPFFAVVFANQPRN